MPKNPTIKQLIVFAILMQDGRGIIRKSPDYVREKWIRSIIDHASCEAALDTTNRELYNEWRTWWGLTDEKLAKEIETE